MKGKVDFVINRNVSNISSFLFYRLPEKYYEPDFGIEVNGGEGRLRY